MVRLRPGHSDLGEQRLPFEPDELRLVVLTIRVFDLLEHHIPGGVRNGVSGAERET